MFSSTSLEHFINKKKTILKQSKTSLDFGRRGCVSLSGNGSYFSSDFGVFPISNVQIQAFHCKKLNLKRALPISTVNSPRNWIASVGMDIWMEASKNKTGYKIAVWTGLKNGLLLGLYKNKIQEIVKM